MSDEALRLIILDDSSNDAESVANLLRNTGRPVRAEHIAEAEDLRTALTAQTWDLLLAKPAVASFSALDALRVVAQFEQDVPLVLMLSTDPGEEIDELLEAGARDAIPVSQQRRLVHAIWREFQTLQERRQMRECGRRLKQTEHRARALVDSSRDAIAYVHEGIHLYVNDSYLSMFGLTDRTELLDMPVMDLIAPEDHGKLKEFLRAHVKGKAQSGNFELSGLKADATTFQINMEFSPATFEDELCTQIIIRDRSDSAELEKKLDELSRLDLPTGLYNRGFFLTHLERELHHNESYQGAIFLLEPADFARLQEEHGIAAADSLIIEVARLLKATLKEEAMLARFGNHTFAWILQQLGQDKMEQVAQGLVKGLRDHIFAIGTRSISIQFQAGITAIDGTVKEVGELIQRAERALVEARRGNRPCQIYAPAASDMTDAERMSIWARQIKLALRENSFVLLYQPVISLRGDSSENYEVLLRMLDNQQNQLPPMEFLQAAENAGLMRGVDRWVLANAAKALAKRRRAGQDTRLFVKLSNASLTDPGFLPWLGELVRAASLGSGVLTLELAEPVARKHLNEVRALSSGLKQFGVRLALEHLVPEGNWTDLLRYCEPNFLKVSGDVVRHLADSREHQEMLKQVCQVAQERDIKTIAQFVENAGTLAYLWTSSVDYAQGYFLHEPSPNLNYDFSFEG